MTADLPRCAVCRVQIEPGHNVVFRVDGRVQHTECPKVICPVCDLPVLPNQPIRRDGERGERLVHANCWIRVHRADLAASRLAPEQPRQRARRRQRRVAF